MIYYKASLGIRQIFFLQGITGVIHELALRLRLNKDLWIKILVE